MASEVGGIGSAGTPTTTFGAQTAMPFTVSEDVTITQVACRSNGTGFFGSAKLGIATAVGSSVTYVAEVSTGTQSAAAGWVPLTLDTPAELTAGVTYYLVTQNTNNAAAKNELGTLTGVIDSRGDIKYGASYGSTLAVWSTFWRIYAEDSETYTGDGQVQIILVPEGDGIPGAVAAGQATLSLTPEGAGRPAWLASGEATLSFSPSGAGEPGFLAAGTATLSLSSTGDGSADQTPPAVLVLPPYWPANEESHSWVEKQGAAWASTTEEGWL